MSKSIKLHPNKEEKVFTGKISKIELKCIDVAIYDPKGNKINIEVNNILKATYRKGGTIEFNQPLITKQ